MVGIHISPLLVVILLYFPAYKTTFETKKKSTENRGQKTKIAQKLPADLDGKVSLFSEVGGSLIQQI